MLSENDVTECLWCRGDGKDHGTLGMPQVRACPRCAGSGRVYVTSRESTTGRRRVYKGPAPRAGAAALRQQQELTETLATQRGAAKTGGARQRRVKDARSHAA